MPAARSGGSADRTRACTALPQGEPAPKIARAVDDPATLAKAAASSEPPWCPGWSADQGVSCHDGLGGPRGEVSGFPGPFPRGLPPNPACTFQCTRLSSDCSVSVAVGCPLWMSVWQGRQTMRVLRRFRAMSVIQAGLFDPDAARSVSLRTWWTWTT